jgi:hypothetical protein
MAMPGAYEPTKRRSLAAAAGLAAGLVGCLVLMGACTDHSDVTLDFRVSSLDESGRVCVRTIDRTYRGYDSCYLVADDVFRTLSGSDASCIRGHVEDPLQPENRDELMAHVRIVSEGSHDCA